MARLPDTDTGQLLPFNIFKVMNHSEALAKGFSSCGSRILSQAKLDPKLRELVINAISLRLDSPYEWSHHGKWALDVGAAREDLEALKSGDYSSLEAKERTCVEYALKVEANDVGEADIERLRTAGLDDQEIVELTITAGFYGMTARFLNAMGVEIDEGNTGGFAIP